jgi:Methyltransferase domain
MKGSFEHVEDKSCREITMISKAIYNTCYIVEKDIVGHDESTARRWAKSNSVRHAHVISTVVAYYLKNNKKRLKILNASGLSCGHQDFSISEYLTVNNIARSWTVYESPRSPYLKDNLFNLLINKYGIFLKLVDFAKEFEISSSATELYDVILLTEIAEHLEYGAFLKLLCALRKMLADSGILIITTPNLAYITNRYYFVLGKSDLGYWGDGCQNMHDGLWGHIVYYDTRRLRRILSDVGLSVVKDYTFNYSAINQESRTKNAMINLLTKLVNNSAQNIFIVSIKSIPKAIEWQI